MIVGVWKSLSLEEGKSWVYAASFAEIVTANRRKHGVCELYSNLVILTTERKIKNRSGNFVFHVLTPEGGSTLVD